MKNEIGRKITSLTLMTIMFAGGMTLAIPGFLPDSATPIEAFADQSTTVGMITVSSTELQGGQVLMITINDPASADPTVTQSAVTSDFNSSTLHYQQMTDGSWVAFVTDQSTSIDADAAGSFMDYGTACSGGLTETTAGTVWTNGANYTWSSDTDCSAPNATYSALTMDTVGNAPKIIVAGTTATAGPAWNGQTGIDLPNWPYITAIDLSSTNIIAYGDDTVLVSYGPEAAGTSLTGPGDFVTQGQQLELTIEDNGLNIDPTTAETWTFTTSSTARTTGATTDIDTTLGIYGFGTNGILSVTDSDEIGRAHV